jgi:CHAT domain-containing protein/Tfp pilus assembly protein PilF
MSPSRLLLLSATLLAANASLSGAASQVPAKAIEARIAEARTLLDKGETQAAKSAYESMLPNLRSGSPSPQLAQVQNALSQIAAGEGNFDSAIDMAREAAQAYHQLQDSDGEVLALNNKSIAEIQRGFYTDAEADLANAITISRNVGHHKNEVESLNNLGSAYFFEGKYFEASRSYQDAMTLVERASPESWSDYWKQITAFNQATLYQRLGRYQDALQTYREVERSSHSLTASDRAHLYTNLGALYRRLGDPWKAMDTYRRALDLYSTQHDSDGEISVLKNIGIVYALDIGDLGKAQNMFEQALAVATKTGNQREEMQEHLYLGETRLRQTSSRDALEQFQNALSLSNKLGTSEEKWKSFYGLGRVKEIDGDFQAAESAYRHAVEIIEATRSQLQLSALKAEFFADKRDAYDALISLLLRRNEISEAFAFLERSRARTFRDRLSSLPKEAPDPPANIDEIQGRLDSSTMVVEIWTAKDQVAWLWCTKNRQGVVRKQLSPETQRQVTAFVRSMPDSLNRNADEVMGQIFDDFPVPTPEIKHLLIVPDGWLSFVPFDLVRAGGKPQPLLIERVDITYLPTAMLLRRPNLDRHVHWPWQRELVAFGNPAISGSATPTEVQDPTESAKSLPYSEKEIRAIAAMTTGKNALFLGPQDQKSVFARQADGAWILHVSTHAFADADNPENSRLLFSSPRKGAAAEYVFLRELYDLDLQRVNLATLSACDTERGKVVRGEGVQAFSRALLSAGSRSALTTLWRVADEPTSEFMKQFYYSALVERLPKAEALRQAKLKLLHSDGPLRTPSNWAAFVLNGDGLTRVPLVISWKMLAASMLALAAVMSGFGVWLALRNQGRNHGVNRT